MKHAPNTNHPPKQSGNTGCVVVVWVASDKVEPSVWIIQLETQHAFIVRKRIADKKIRIDIRWPQHGLQFTERFQGQNRTQRQSKFRPSLRSRKRLCAKRRVEPRNREFNGHRKNRSHRGSAKVGRILTRHGKEKASTAEITIDVLPIKKFYQNPAITPIEFESCGEALSSSIVFDSILPRE